MASDFFIFQQDSAPQHIEQITPLRCCDVKHQASLNQISGQQTQKTSIQLNLGLIQERVYQTAIRNIDELNERLTVVWAELKQSVIDKAIEQWRPRLRACVQA